MDLEKLTYDVSELCRKAGEFIQKEVTHLRLDDIELKSANNFVTYVDRRSEELLVEGLSGLIPRSGFIAEENPSLQAGELTWVIDPLDGTTNFIHGVPIYSISVGLMEQHEVILGVILEINSGECFYTWKGSTSFLNGKVIRVSDTSSVSDGLFATGFPYYDYGRLDHYLNFFRYLMKNSRGVRRLGSAAADMAYVACGRFEGFYEYGLNPWDVAAGDILIRNAGGKVSDFKGGNDYIFGKEIIAANFHIYPEFMKVFKENFRQNR